MFDLDPEGVSIPIPVPVPEDVSIDGSGPRLHSQSASQNRSVKERLIPDYIHGNGLNYTPTHYMEVDYMGPYRRLLSCTRRSFSTSMLVSWSVE